MGPRRILIIDDDPALVESLSAALSPPYTVRGASDGETAIASLKTERADLVILDLHLGPEDGLELLPRLRELTPAPILVLTGFGSREDLLRSIRAKPDDFLDKPVGIPELRSRVATLLRRIEPEDDPLERIRAWIAREFPRPLAALALARAAGMSPSRLRRAFAGRFGVTPRAYLEECRMTRAAALLRETNLRVKEVATQVGFRDPNNFSTAFKRFHACSPEALRAQHRHATSESRPPE